jgi:exodeoxyribonuclease-3
VVLCGDLNVAHTALDLAHPKSNRGKKGFTDEERQGFQNLLDAGFIDTLRLFRQGGGHYTWWSPFVNARARNIGWRIDYFLVSGALRAAVKAADVHADVMGSDHCPVSVTLDLPFEHLRDNSDATAAAAHERIPAQPELSLEAQQSQLTDQT